MDTKKTIEFAETICECAMGAAIGICLDKTIYPKCNKLEKALVVTGGSLVSWMLGRRFYKEFMGACGEPIEVEETVQEPTME